MKNKLFHHLLPLLCALAMLLGLAACGGGEKPKDTPESKPAEVQTPKDPDPVSDPDPAPASEPEPKQEAPAEDVSCHFADGVLTITCNVPGVKIYTNMMDDILKEATGLTNVQDCINAVTSLIINGDDTTFFDSFSHSENLISVELNGISTIWDSAFEECTSLASVQFSDGLVTIGDRAFYNTNLTDVQFPDSLVTIGNEAFRGTSLSQITIPASVEFIGLYVFSYATNLTDVYFEDDLEIQSFGDYPHGAFYEMFFSGESPDVKYTVTIHAASGSNIETLTQRAIDAFGGIDTLSAKLRFEPLA